MNIVLVTELYFPGVNGMITAIRGLAETLSGAGHSVVLIGPNSALARTWAEDYGIQFVPVPSIVAPARIGQCIGVWPLATRDIQAIVRRCDVVHLHSPFLTGLVVARHARKENVPIVVTNHALPENLCAALRISSNAGERLLGQLVWKWIGVSQRFADISISPSQYAAQLLREKFGALPLRVISNGIECPNDYCLATIESKEPLRAVYVGRLQREKRVDELIHGVDACLQAGLPVRFTIVGDGPERVRLESLVRRLGLRSHVTFVGVVSDEARDQHYRTAHCLWMASRSELQCCAAMEAMAVARPVVASRARALPETIPDGIAGCLYSPGDLAQLVEIVRRLLHQPGFYHQLALGARATAMDHQLSVVAETVATVYSRLIQQRRQKLLRESYTERLDA